MSASTTRASRRRAGPCEPGALRDRRSWAFEDAPSRSGAPVDRDVSGHPLGIEGREGADQDPSGRKTKMQPLDAECLVHPTMDLAVIVITLKNFENYRIYVNQNYEYKSKYLQQFENLWSFLE